MTNSPLETDNETLCESVKQNDKSFPLTEMVTNASNEDTTKVNRNCAVGGCNLPISGVNNLCDEHRLPGASVRAGDSTFVITLWVAEHENEVGIILLNDFALGDLFGGRAGFEKRLHQQGFTGARLLCTQEEIESAKRPANGKKMGKWSGPWLMEYPWEVVSEEPKVDGLKLKGRVDMEQAKGCSSTPDKQTVGGTFLGWRPTRDRALL
jgi:hypothetical protein